METSSVKNQTSQCGNEWPGRPKPAKKSKPKKPKIPPKPKTFDDDKGRPPPQKFRDVLLKTPIKPNEEYEEEGWYDDLKTKAGNLVKKAKEKGKELYEEGKKKLDEYNDPTKGKVVKPGAKRLKF